MNIISKAFESSNEKLPSSLTIHEMDDKNSYENSLSSQKTQLQTR